MYVGRRRRQNYCEETEVVAQSVIELRRRPSHRATSSTQAERLGAPQRRRLTGAVTQSDTRRHGNMVYQTTRLCYRP